MKSIHRIAVHLAIWYVVWIVACLFSSLNTTDTVSKLYYLWLLTSVSICAFFTSRNSSGIYAALACGFFVCFALFHQGIGYVLYVDGGGMGPAFFLALLAGTQGAIVAAISLTMFRYTSGKLHKENKNTQSPQ